MNYEIQIKQMRENIKKLTESNNNLVYNQELAMTAIKELAEKIKILENKIERMVESNVSK